MSELAKQYNPGEIEPRWAREWVEKRLFEADPNSKRPMFSLVIPPPNVTGSLHMGHMLEHTLIDIIVRWKRMQGMNTLWLPGTDHAGIATQMVVERQLAEQKLDRRTMGRETFEKKVWEWKAQSGDTIKRQMLRLGTSCDWSRERFTLDPGLSRAVREVFVSLYEDGLIYRGKYIVNWCPRCQTAISDLEVVHEDTPGHLYHIRYRVTGTDQFLVVATTRPETMLGDTAVAVNPHDERYKHFHGKTVHLPLMQREIPIIVDEFADPAFGTGVVKVTPAHDPNDFLAGQRHNLPQIDVMDDTGKMNQNAGAYTGLDRFEARKRILANLEAQGFLVKVEPHTLSLGRCQRCRTVVEPRLSTQWFVKMAPLAAKGIGAVEEGRTRFVPENYGRIYFEWLTNIHDWCISRQLWWGHRIPAWHCGACGKTTVAREDPAACSHCGKETLTQDPDVLDTWFSSALWPFSTLGWPEQTRDLKVFYPTTLMITGFDILFFWVARMMMMGLEFMGDVPFREVYIHALVRDADKQKMSKTRGNVIDPLVVTEKYGTDAVRFTLAIMSPPGTDIALSEDRMEGYRAFANKIWNAARFVFMSLDKSGAPPWSPPVDGNFVPVPNADGTVSLEDRWIFSRLSQLARDMAKAWDAYRYHEAADLIYHFFWHEFCDWYLELKKLGFESAAQQASVMPPAFENLCRAFDVALRLLHPTMPFITEELWQRLAERGAESIALAQFPRPDDTLLVDENAEREMALLQEIIVNIRNLRAELNEGARQKPPATLLVYHPDVRDVAERHRKTIEKLGNLSELSISVEFDMAESFRGSWQVRMPEIIDVEMQRGLLQRQQEKLSEEITRLRNQLENRQFVSKAPPHILAQRKERMEEVAAELQQVTASLQQLK